ncbi:choice-of-anchor D domain-containing protein, partial [bacterium]|nr:choice-of-anchor D domain-containing protein [bacterium]
MKNFKGFIRKSFIITTCIVLITMQVMPAFANSIAEESTNKKIEDLFISDKKIRDEKIDDLFITNKKTEEVFTENNDFTTIKDQIFLNISNVLLSVDRDNGNAKFEFEDTKNIQYVNKSGEPMIPYQIVRAILPPDADLTTVEVELQNQEFEEISGKWEVSPTPPIMTWDPDLQKEIVLWPKDKEIQDGKDISIYNSNTFFPENILGKQNVGQMRKWKIVDFPVSQFQYNPITRKLRKLVYFEPVIHFNRLILSTDEKNVLASDRLADNRVEELVDIFEVIAPEYDKYISRFPQQSGGYAIITTDSIYASSTMLGDFITHKQNRGFTVHVATEDDWGGGIGDIASDNIRNWLIDNYISLNIEYVLLIGGPDTGHGDVPMKMLWPRNGDSYYPQYTDSPSDYYYADLTGNWDLDGDGFFGEEDDDFGVNNYETGIDKNYEVVVGRIPYYGILNDLDHILEKTINYQNETRSEASWRKNVLLPMVPSDSNTPGYDLGEEIKDDYISQMDDWGYHRIYAEDYGLNPSPESTPNGQYITTDAWTGNTFGSVFWWTHGGQESASWIINTSQVSGLDDTHPGFTFQSSCLNSYPENNNNLSYALLKNGGIATISATRVSWYWGQQDHYDGTSSNSGMTSQYAKRLILGKEEGGYALHDLKQELTLGTWMNFTVFNLYGDPEVGLFSFGSEVPDINVKSDNGESIRDDIGSYDFGHVSLGSNLTKTFTIENTGNSVLELTLPIQIIGDPEFSISNSATSSQILPNESTTFEVTFIANTEETKTAEIMIDSNDLDESPYNFVITATGGDVP